MVICIDHLKIFYLFCLFAALTGEDEDDIGLADKQ